MATFVPMSLCFPGPEGTKKHPLLVQEEDDLIISQNDYDLETDDPIKASKLHQELARRFHKVSMTIQHVQNEFTYWLHVQERRTKQEHDWMKEGF